MSTEICNICELRCRLDGRRTGICGLYQFNGEQIVERFPDHYLVVCPISIETMPILHYRPGAKFLQISTTGCNFNCPGCISTVLVREMSHDSRALKHLSADQIVVRARTSGCQGIVFLMNDPIAAFPRFLKIAELAHARGLKVGCSSNAYFTTEALSQLLPCLNFINIGMKGFTDEAYRRCGVPGIQPVLRNLAALHTAGVHIEISCILTRENTEELERLAHHLAAISIDIPLQVMRFLPFETAAQAQEPTILEAEVLCRKLRQILNFVYLFNSPGTELLQTACPHCGQVVLRRDFYGPMGAKVQIPLNATPHTGHCPACTMKLPVIGSAAEDFYQEGDFEGGYPLTRALEMVEAMLIAMGVTHKTLLAHAWEDLLQGDGLSLFHKSIQNPRTYIDAVRHFGKIAKVSSRAEALAEYMEDRLDRIENALQSNVRRPRVYYAMGKPLFHINGGRMENQLVETAGGTSLNRALPKGGRPGRTLAVDELNRLNPEVIFVSAFLGNPISDFYDECMQLGLQIDAVRNRRIYTHPAPGWDFGSPRWILGLMHIAATLHPQKCAFDVAAEADRFYRTFYGLPWRPDDGNRSFSKPSRHWRWRPCALETESNSIHA